MRGAVFGRNVEQIAVITIENSIILSKFSTKHSAKISAPRGRRNQSQALDGRKTIETDRRAAPPLVPSWCCGERAVGFPSECLIGGGNADWLPQFTRPFSHVLRDMRGEVWANPPLLLANGPLLQEMRQPLQGAAGGRSEMASMVASGLGRNRAVRVPPWSDLLRIRFAPLERVDSN